MIVRPATLADLNACLLLDHSCVTDHVWQMKVEELESQVSVTFHTVRLPRRMRADYPRDLEQLVEDWQRGEGFLVAEVDSEVRGYIDLLRLASRSRDWLRRQQMFQDATTLSVACARRRLLDRDGRCVARGTGPAIGSSRVDPTRSCSRSCAIRRARSTRCTAARPSSTIQLSRIDRTPGAWSAVPDARSR